MKLIPATVHSWDGKELRVHIQGYTDGASKPVKADICYPLADRPSYTGYRILPGDAVWVMFNGGDFDCPIVMGFRNKNTGQDKDTRAFTHKNFKVDADQDIKLNATQTTVTAPTNTYNGNLIVNGDVSVTGGGSSTYKGNLVIEGNVKVKGNIEAGGSIHGSSVTDDDGDGGA